MTISNRRFCAAESVLRGENLLGTATESACYLLVEHDGAWPTNRAKILEPDGIGCQLRAALEGFVIKCPEDVHILLIRGRCRSSTRKVYLVRSNRGDSCGGYWELDPASEITTEQLVSAYESPTAIPEILLICTHGKKDKCCAKFGYPVFDRMRAELQGVEVYQCSHVGGDRFAANVIWLPYGIYLGHVHAELEYVITKIRERKIPLDHYRGVAHLPSAAQFLEGFSRKKNLFDELCAIELMNYQETPNAQGEVTHEISLRFLGFGLGIVRGTVKVSQKSEKVIASCNAGGMAIPRAFEVITYQQQA